jgi:hypothetical protein
MGAGQDRSLLGAVTDFGVFRIRFSTLCLSLVFGFVLPYPTLPSFRQPFHSTSKSKVQVPLSPHFHLDNRKFLSLRTLISIYVYIILHSPPHIPIPHRWLFFSSRAGGDLRAPLVYMYIRYMCFTPRRRKLGS